jgi:hypothetical protein
MKTLQQSIRDSVVIRDYKLLVRFYKRIKPVNFVTFFLLFGWLGYYAILESRPPEYLLAIIKLYAVFFILFIFLGAIYHILFGYEVKYLSKLYRVSEQTVLFEIEKM